LEREAIEKLFAARGSTTRGPFADNVAHWPSGTDRDKMRHMNRAEVIARLKSAEPQLRAHGVAALYLFGSYARDEARPESDIDVFVDPGSEDFYDLEHFIGAHEALEEVLGHSVDYGTGDGIVRFYRPAIEGEAIRIF
jgi:predicted nucleotidyltransferase